MIPLGRKAGAVGAGLARQGNRYPNAIPTTARAVMPSPLQHARKSMPSGGTGGGRGRWRDRAVSHWNGASNKRKALYAGGAGAAVLGMSRRGESSGSNGAPPPSSSGGGAVGYY